MKVSPSRKDASAFENRYGDSEALNTAAGLALLADDYAYTRKYDGYLSQMGGLRDLHNLRASFDRYAKPFEIPPPVQMYIPPVTYGGSRNYLFEY